MVKLAPKVVRSTVARTDSIHCHGGREATSGGEAGEKRTRVNAIELELLVDVGFLLLDVCRAVDGCGSHGAGCDATITGVSNAASTRVARVLADRHRANQPWQGEWID